MTPNADVDLAAYSHTPSSPEPAARAAAEPETAEQETRRFAELVLPLQSALYARALGLARSSADAGDLVQDTLERALRSFHTFQRGTNMKLWLFRIMHNLFVDRCRRRAREPWRKSSTVGPLAMGSVAGPDPEANQGWDPAEELELREA